MADAVTKAQEWDRRFEKPDVWQFITNPWHWCRFEDTLSMFEALEQRGLILEVGCHEGAFTKRMADRLCYQTEKPSRIVAVDVSEVALARARELVKCDRVEFKQIDFTTQKVVEPGTVDIAVVMELLYYERGAAYSIKERLIEAVKIGGAIVLEHVLTSGPTGKPVADVDHAPYRGEHRLREMHKFVRYGDSGPMSYEVAVFQRMK